MLVAQCFSSRILGLAMVATSLAMAAGCSTMSIPTMKMPSMGSLARPWSPDVDKYEFIGEGASPASASMSEAAYRKVKQAQAENAIVLQVTGDDVPLRVLPLPPAEGTASGTPQPVFVSTLISQTGVTSKLGGVNAALFRVAPGSLNGVRMDVLFDGNDSVRPETDYALRAGDRLVLSKKEGFTLETLIDMAMDR